MCGIAVGDRVKIVRCPLHETDFNHLSGWNNTWVPTMTMLFEKESIGTVIDFAFTNGGIYVKFGFYRYCFPYWALKKVDYR